MGEVSTIQSMLFLLFRKSFRSSLPSLQIKEIRDTSEISEHANRSIRFSCFWMLTSSLLLSFWKKLCRVCKNGGLILPPAGVFRRRQVRKIRCFYFFIISGSVFQNTFGRSVGAR